MASFTHSIFVLTLCTSILSFAQEEPAALDKSQEGVSVSTESDSEGSPNQIEGSTADSQTNEPPETPVSGSPDTIFSEGLSLYQKGDFANAARHFSKLTEEDPKNSVALYNLGLSQFKLGNTGLALAHWRKALFLDPSLTSAREAVEFALVGENKRASSLGMWETFRDGFLSRTSVDGYLALSLLTAVFFLWVLIGYLARRKRALDNEEAAPMPSNVSLALGTLFCLSLLFTFLKLRDDSVPRATVITKSTSVRTGPSPNASTLFELIEGTEVIVRESKDKWIKIQSSTGQEGWADGSMLMVTN